jgi:hypothetical protein
MCFGDLFRLGWVADHISGTIPFSFGPEMGAWEVNEPLCWPSVFHLGKVETDLGWMDQDPMNATGSAV